MTFEPIRRDGMGELCVDGDSLWKGWEMEGKKERHLVDVIERMLEVIPIEEYHLREALLGLRRMITYWAPERVIPEGGWDVCSAILGRELGFRAVETEWMKQVRLIFSDQEGEER